MPVPGESKAFSAGSQLPDTGKNDLTVYSMRFCPYAERVRLVLNYKNVPYDVININLQSKPQWFLERNPLGKVPAVEEPGKKPLFESLICAEYFDEKFPQKRLLPADPYERARQKLLIELIAQKYTTPFYGILLKGDPEAAVALKKGLGEIEEMLTGQYFAGEKMGYVDLMVWPWIQRFEAINQVKNLCISLDKQPKLAAWIKAMNAEQVVRETTYPQEFFVKFLQSAVDGKPDYDIGL